MVERARARSPAGQSMGAMSTSRVSRAAAPPICVSSCLPPGVARSLITRVAVHVPGAKFSVGDLHFSQGDGEISFCGAIEMAGVITIKFSVLKNGVADLASVSPLFIPGPVEPLFSPTRVLTFEGFSVDEKGRQHYLDATVAYRQACLRAFEYLRRFGYSDYQLYLLFSAAPIQGRIGALVDVSQEGAPLFLIGSRLTVSRSRMHA